MSEEYIYNEKELLLRIAQGDQASFSKLLSQHWSAVYVFALMYLHIEQTAEELTQDVFLDVWKQRKTLTEIDRRNYTRPLTVTTATGMKQYER